MLISSRLDGNGVVLFTNGRSSTAITERIADPRRPAMTPNAVTPPFVPLGTVIQGVVIRRGGVVARIPSSELIVSAVAAA